jgi:hypothetical protein
LNFLGFGERHELGAMLHDALSPNTTWIGGVTFLKHGHQYQTWRLQRGAQLPLDHDL